jgi:creatinine amidohydrolase
LAANAPLILPVGTIEWHSHHLPLGLDGLVAEALAARVAARCRGVLAPTSWWAAGGVQFPHTFRLDRSLIESLMDAVLLEYARLGFRVVLLINGHFGLEHSLLSRLSALACMRETNATVLAVAPYEVLTDQGNHGDHAGTWETSLLMAIHEHLVDAQALKGDGELPGIIGDDPRGRASKELGERALATATERLAAMVVRAAHEDSQARTLYRDAIESAGAALDVLATLRATRPRPEVPPVSTPIWRMHLEALVEGRYRDAAELADRKRQDPAA